MHAQSGSRVPSASSAASSSFAQANRTVLISTWRRATGSTKTPWGLAAVRDEWLVPYGCEIVQGSRDEVAGQGVKVPKPRRRRIKPWSVVEAGRFLADSLSREDPLFATRCSSSASACWPDAVLRCRTPPKRQKPRSDPGLLACCALGRIRTCNLLIRSQMLYPLSYECLFCFFAAPCPSGPLAATGRTLHDCRSHVKSVSRTPCDLRKRTSERGRERRSPGRWDRGFGDLARRRRDLNPRWDLSPKPH